jgi:hypothetical protein
MTISPRYSIWLSVILAVLAYLSGAAASFTDLGLSPTHVKQLMAGIGLVLGIGNSVNAVLAAIPSKSTPEELAKFPLGPKESK